MKIGILTHHYVKNYGAFLQMRGLYKTLERLYPEAEILIIDYVRKKHWRKNIIHVLHYRRTIDTPSTYAKKIKQLSVFTKYEKSLPRTEKVRNEKEINALGLDMLVLGSDEIWNLHGSGYHPLKCGYGLEKMNVIAYAPSVGAVTDETMIPKEVQLGISSIKRISGRDIETIKFVKRASGNEAVKMLDPTFLYNFDLDIAKEKIAPKPYKYILVYDCKLTDELVKELRQYADKHGYKILGAGDYKPFYDEVTINLTPFEWVSLFRNAEKVITGTFHGTVFSIKYDRDVVCYPTEKNRINKILSLLTDMRINERLLKVGRESDFVSMLTTEMDYSDVHQYIAQKQKEAEEFLLFKSENLYGGKNGDCSI